MHHRKEYTLNGDLRGARNIANSDWRGNMSHHLTESCRSLVAKEGCAHRSFNHYQPEEPYARMMNVLLDENSNLKQQNCLLQQKLNDMILREKQLSETINEYESIIAALHHRNPDLHRETLHFSHRASSRTDGLKTTIQHMMRVSKRNQPRMTAPVQYQGDYEQFVRECETNQQNSEILMRDRVQGERVFVKDVLNSPSSISVPHQTTEFQRLLEKCQLESDSIRKKHLWKKLMSVVYQRSEVAGRLQ